MHSRMRFRVSEFQKILNRAKMETVTSTDRKTVRYVLDCPPLVIVSMKTVSDVVFGLVGGRWLLVEPRGRVEMT